MIRATLKVAILTGSFYIYIQIYFNEAESHSEVSVATTSSMIEDKCTNDGQKGMHPSALHPGFTVFGLDCLYQIHIWFRST